MPVELNLEMLFRIWKYERLKTFCILNVCLNTYKSILKHINTPNMNQNLLLCWLLVWYFRWYLNNLALNLAFGMPAASAEFSLHKSLHKSEWTEFSILKYGWGCAKYPQISGQGQRREMGYIKICWKWWYRIGKESWKGPIMKMDKCIFNQYMIDYKHFSIC